MSDRGPPSYEDAISHNINTPLSGPEQYTLVLDGCTIYPATPPSQFLYEITSPPCHASNAVYGVHKWRYRLSDHVSDGTIKSRLDHIYDVKDFSFNSMSSLRPAVKLEGKLNNRRSYREVVLQGGHTGWSSCAATEGWFKTEMSMRDRFKKDGQVAWRSRDGVLVAVERRIGRREDGSVSVLPRLEIREAITEKSLDLLVSCWVARVWKEAQAELREFLTWKDFKRIASHKTKYRDSTLSGPQPRETYVV